MKKLLMFFSGVLLLVLTFLSLYFSGVLFDTGAKRYIDYVVFQPNNLSSERIGNPVSIDKLSETFIRDRLIKRFVNEYFYVSPVDKSTSIRTRSDSLMAAISAPSVFAEWKKITVPELTILSDKKTLRKTNVTDEIIKKGEYWVVATELKTWEKPNDMDLLPTTDTRILYLKITFEKDLRDMRAGKTFDIKKYLEDGGDPAAIFKFRVDEIKQVIEK